MLHACHTLMAGNLQCNMPHAPESGTSSRGHVHTGEGNIGRLAFWAGVGMGDGPGDTSESCSLRCCCCCCLRAIIASCRFVLGLCA